MVALVALTAFAVQGSRRAGVDDLTAITEPVTIVMDGLNGTSALDNGTLYANGSVLSLGGSGYSDKKGSSTINGKDYKNVYQIKSNRQIVLKIGFDATVTIYGQTNSDRAWQIGTTSAGKDIAAGANGDGVVSGVVYGALQPQLIYINATGDLYLAGIEITKAPAKEAEDATFSLTKTEINEFGSSQIVVNGKSNLDGLTMNNLQYDNKVISIDNTGKITPVAAGTSSISFTTEAVANRYNAGTADLSITVNEVVLDEQADVTADATWDWSQFGTTEILLTDATPVKKDVDEFVLSNVVKYGFCDAIGAGFGNAQQLLVAGLYAVRDGKYFQGSTVKFNTTVPGKLAVTYSNTGNRDQETDRRYLNVNGTNCGDGTMNTDFITTSDIPVAAGTVTISGRKGTDTEKAEYLRISKIVFTAGEPVVEPIVWAGDEVTLEAGTDMSIPAAMVSGISDGKLVRITATEVEAVASRRALAAEDITILKSDDTELGVTVETINEGYQFTVTGDQANELVQNGFKVKANKTIKISAIEVVDNSTIDPEPVGDTGTIKFGKDDVNINKESVTGNDNLGNTWTITTVGTTSFTANASYYQVGSSNKPATSITFSTTLSKDVNITSFSAKFGGFSSTAGNISLKVDETEVGSGKLNGTDDVTVESTKSETGKVLTVSVTNIAKGVKCYEISYTFNDETDQRVKTSIVFADGYATEGMEGTKIALPTATVKDANGNTIDGATITWSSTNEDVASINGNEINLLKQGTSVIKATYTGDETNYKDSEKSYTLNVTETDQIANPYVYVFDKKTFDENDLTKKLKNVTWTVTTDAGYFGYDTNATTQKGQQFGSGSKPATYLTVKLSDIPGTITSVKVNTSGAKDIAATFGIKVGETSFQNGEATEATLTSEATDYTFTGSASGDVVISYTQTSSVAIYIKSIEIAYTESVPVAEITKVQISGAPYGVDQWTSLDFAVDPTQGNVYTATLDLSETTENYQFKLVINGGGSKADNWGGWIGTNNVTIDAPEGWGYWTDDKDNENLWLYNSTTGYKTYTLTATWTPGDNAYKGWTLKIEGKDERTAILAGDANLDNEVTVSDAVLAVSFVTEKETPTAEQLIAADLDKSNSVDITDAQGIVNIALGITDQASASRAIELADNTLSVDGTQLLLQNQTMFTGFQMDVTLENGAELNGVQLSDRAKDMTLVYNKVGNNTWRIAAISLSRTAISGNDGCLLTLDVNGNVNVNNNIFTDANTQGYSLSLTAPTGISAIKAAMAEGTVVYDMQGRRVENPAKGLYIVNGKKVVLK